MASGDSWLKGMGAHFPQKDVVIVHREDDGTDRRTNVRGSVLSDTGTFDIDTPVFRGDIVEMDDPRGGIRRLYVTKVDVNDVRGGQGFHGMSHVHVHWTDEQPGQAPAPAPLATYTGPVFQVSGGVAQIAWGNRDVQQHVHVSQVAPGWEILADAVTRTLQLLAASDGVEVEDREIASDVGSEVLTELGKPSPNRSVVRRGLAALRGLLMTAAGAAATEAGKALIAALVLPDAPPVG